MSLQLFFHDLFFKGRGWLGGGKMSFEIQCYFLCRNMLKDRKKKYCSDNYDVRRTN